MSTSSELGRRLRAARKTRNITLLALAKEVGVAYQTLQDLQRGDSKGSKHIVQIAAALNVKPEWLLSGKGEQRAAEACIAEKLGLVGAAAGNTDELAHVLRWLATEIGTIARFEYPPHIRGTLIGLERALKEFHQYVEGYAAGRSAELVPKT